MVNIVDLDLETTKQYLRVEYEEDDQLIEMMLVFAKSYIQSYMNKKFEEFDAIPDELTIPALALISHWYERREIETDKAAKEIVYTFLDILDMHRIWQGGLIE